MRAPSITMVVSPSTLPAAVSMRCPQCRALSGAAAGAAAAAAPAVDSSFAAGAPPAASAPQSSAAPARRSAALRSRRGAEHSRVRHLLLLRVSRLPVTASPAAGRSRRPPDRGAARSPLRCGSSRRRTARRSWRWAPPPRDCTNRAPRRSPSRWHRSAKPLPRGAPRRRKPGRTPRPAPPRRSGSRPSSACRLSAASTTSLDLLAQRAA